MPQEPRQLCEDLPRELHPDLVASMASHAFGCVVCSFNAAAMHTNALKA
jgi:hypothetical protein